MKSKIAIVDYGLGNLFSIKNACEFVGLQVVVTSDKADIKSADAVILPGVGAFGDAMRSLSQLGLVGLLKDLAESKKPLIGICLGLQLLFSESEEFGFHKGLDIIKGRVTRLDESQTEKARIKVPQVGWNSIHFSYNFENYDCLSDNRKYLLRNIDEGEFMYFVHSFYAIPNDSSIILTHTRYGDLNFCSSLKFKNIYAFQFHPERSGPNGLKIYKNMALIIKRD